MTPLISARRAAEDFARVVDGSKVSAEKCPLQVRHQAVEGAPPGQDVEVLPHLTKRLGALPRGGGKSELDPVVGAVEVAQISAQVALWVQVHCQHSPPTERREASEVGGQARLADTALAVQDEDRVVNQVGHSLLVGSYFGKRNAVLRHARG